MRTIRLKLKREFFNRVSIKLIAKYVDVIVTPSELEKEALIAHGISPHRVVIIRNFIPDSYFKFRPRGFGDLLERYSIEPYKYVITVARIDRNKSIHQVIEAIARLYRRGINIRYVLIGPDEGALNYYLALVRKYGVEQNFIYLGPIYDKRIVLALNRYALAFVLPSYIESAQPLSVLEAMSQGTPVIISNTANLLGRSVHHMFNGLVFKYGDSISLANKIRLLLDDTGLRKRLGENALRYAYDNHRLSKAVKKYIAIYKLLSEAYNVD